MDDALQRQICIRIKQARKRAGFTQMEMADLLELTLRGYQNYETRRVPFRRLTEIARLTNVEERWLLYGGEALSQDDLRGALSDTLALLRSIDGHLVRIERAMPVPGDARRQAGQPRS